jgi:hypothetical protein
MDYGEAYTNAYLTPKQENIDEKNRQINQQLSFNQYNTALPNFDDEINNK